jgi:hypothetical protein
MKKLILIFLLLTSISVAKAQNPGYFGKKNIIELDFVGTFPLLSNFKVINWYKADGDHIVNRKDYFDCGVRLGLVHTFRRNFAAGVEIGQDYFSVNFENYFTRYQYLDGFQNLESINAEHENVDVRALVIMPKVEFSSKGGLLPMGLSHQVGVGIRMNQAVEKPYVYEPDYYSGSGDPASFGKDFYNYDDKPILGMTAMYAINMRTPLTKSLLLNYGLRYTLNFMKKTIYNNGYTESADTSNDIYWVNRAEMQSAIRSRKQTSFILFNIGLSYAL